jgi:hypothetical protein
MLLRNPGGGGGRRAVGAISAMEGGGGTGNPAISLLGAGGNGSFGNPTGGTGMSAALAVLGNVKPGGGIRLGSTAVVKESAVSAASGAES